MYRRGGEGAVFGGSAGHRAACNTAQAIWFCWNLWQISLGFQQAGISPPELMGMQWKQSALPESPHSYLHIWLAVVWTRIKGELFFFSDRVSESHMSFWGGIVCTWFLTSLFGVIWRITDSWSLPVFINFSFSTCTKEYSFGIKKTCLGKTIFIAISDLLCQWIHSF